jgi:hypothetical protein
MPDAKYQASDFSVCLSDPLYSSEHLMDGITCCDVRYQKKKEGQSLIQSQSPA